MGERDLIDFDAIAQEVVWDVLSNDGQYFKRPNDEEVREIIRSLTLLRSLRFPDQPPSKAFESSPLLPRAVKLLEDWKRAAEEGKTRQPVRVWFSSDATAGQYLSIEVAASPEDPTRQGYQELRFPVSIPVLASLLEALRNHTARALPSVDGAPDRGTAPHSSDPDGASASVTDLRESGDSCDTRSMGDVPLQNDLQAELDEMTRRLTPRLSVSDARRLQAIIEKAKDSPPPNKELFVEGVNRLLTAYQHRLDAGNGKLGVLCVKPGATGRGHIQLAFVNGGTGAFKSVAIRLVPYGAPAEHPGASDPSSPQP